MSARRQGWVARGGEPPASRLQAPGCQTPGWFPRSVKRHFPFFCARVCAPGLPGPVHWGRRRAQGGGESRYERRGEKVRREGSSRRRALEMVGCRLPAFRRAALPASGAHGVMGLLPTKFLQTLFSAAFQIKRPKGSALCLWLRLRTATPTVSRSTSRPVQRWCSFQTTSTYSYTTSHSRNVGSLLPDASVCPSGLKHTDNTESSCPSSVLTHAPVSTSHSRTVLS